MQRTAFLIAAAAFVIGVAGYLLWGRQRRDTEAPARVVAAGSSPATGAAVIEGEVHFTGAAPVPGKLHREADPYCARQEMTDPTVLVADGRLANVWVHVIEGAPDAPPPPTPVDIDQRDCMYSPRVTTAVVRQKIVARNGDPILHNRYVLEAWHEKLGVKTLEATAPGRVVFEYSGAEQ